MSHAKDLPVPAQDKPAGIPQPGERYILVNAVEATVVRQVAEMIQYIEMCRCEKCFKDACALVLNQMQPHYVTTRRGELLTQVNQSVRDKHIDLTVKVVQALQLVKESPRH